MKKNTFSIILVTTLIIFIFLGKTTTACNANFTHTNACAGDTVWFFAADQFAVYTWDFGDNSSEVNVNHDTNTFHVYATPGTYIVMLFVNVGAEWDYSTQIITVGTDCFYANYTTTCGGSNYMYFYSQSPGAVWQTWNFGDPSSGVNNTSTDLNPYHLYPNPGTYSVMLIANNGSIADTSTQTVVVPVNCIGATFYSGSFANCVQDSTVFNVSYSGTITTYNWNFGDVASGANNISTLANPKHQYSASGIYMVTLIISNGVDTQTILYCLSVVDCNCWAGDANGDGEVNADDIFPLGMFYGDHGPKRTGASNSFTSQPGTDWLNYNSWMYLQAMKNKKIADCNGDSTINAADLTVVMANYGMSHTTHNNVSGMPEATAADPSLYIQLPSGSATSGATITAPIYLGTAAHPCVYLYGYSFSINYDPALIVPGSAFINLTSNWLGNATNELMLTHDDYANGKIDAAVVRYDKTQIASGFGQISTITFTLQNAVSGTLKLTFSPSAKALSTTMYAATLSSNMEVFRPIYLVESTLSVALGVASYGDDNAVELYPNPSKNTINVTISQESEIEILNLAGQVLETINAVGKQITIDISDLTSGLYFMKIKNVKAITTKKFIKE